MMNVVTKADRYQVLVWGTALFLVVLGLVLAAYAYGRSQNPASVFEEDRESGAPHAKDAEGLTLYAEALAAVEEDYIDQETLDPEEQAYGAIEGMIDSLGDEGHTRFLTLEEVEKTREAISNEHSEVVSWNPIPGTDTAHLRLALFSEDAAAELEEAVAEAREAGARRFVLDLRGNEGGRVKQAEEVAARFLAGGSEIYTRRDADGEEQKTVPGDNEPLDAPLVVLVNGKSASSAEIVAGAFRDSGRATVVGETTFGAGTVLDKHELSDGSAVLLAVAEWLTPNGDSIRGSGIEPDVEAKLEKGQEPRAPDEVGGLSGEGILEEDAQLERAFEVLQEEQGTG